MYQLHRLREVMILVGFSRFEAIMPDIDGEYDTDVSVASIAARADLVPGRRESRGRDLRAARATGLSEWLEREGVRRRLAALEEGHGRWASQP